MSEYLAGSTYAAAVAIEEDEPETVPEPDRTDPGPICGVCGHPKERADWVACIACLVGRFDEAAVARLAEERDALAAWLIEAESVLSGLPRDDPRRVRGEAIWRRKLRSYQALCYLVPEPRA